MEEIHRRRTSITVPKGVTEENHQRRKGRVDAKRRCEDHSRKRSVRSEGRKKAQVPDSGMRKLQTKVSYEDNYAGGADAASIRTAIRRAVLEGWKIASKDVSTAFLNAEYSTAQGVLLLTPPNVVKAAGLMKEGEAWIVQKAIYGQRESPKLWSMERGNKLSKMILKVKGRELSLRKIPCTLR